MPPTQSIAQALQGNQDSPGRVAQDPNPWYSFDEITVVNSDPEMGAEIVGALLMSEIDKLGVKRLDPETIRRLMSRRPKTSSYTWEVDPTANLVKDGQVVKIGPKGRGVLRVRLPHGVEDRSLFIILRRPGAPEGRYFAAPVTQSTAVRDDRFEASNPKTKYVSRITLPARRKRPPAGKQVPAQPAAAQQAAKPVSESALREIIRLLIG